MGTGKIYAKLSQNAVFPGKFHDNKFGIFAKFIVRTFVVIWEAPIREHFPEIGVVSRLLNYYQY